MSSAKPGYMKNFFTPAEAFYEITRSRPYRLPENERRKVGLTPETWQLEIVGDDVPWQPILKKTCRKEDGTAVTFKVLEELFATKPVRCIKTLQCLLDHPDRGLCSNGYWEGVSLRDVLMRLGPLTKVRRIYYQGYFAEPKQRFVSSLALSEVLETPPGHLPIMLAFKLNGGPLPIERGGPVRLLAPEMYGFKSIKWLNKIVLTNDYRPNDTYATEFGDVPLAPDPFAPMKTVARLDVHNKLVFKRGESITISGVATVGASGLQRVDYWLRPDQGNHGKLDADDPAWQAAEWKPTTLAATPPANWTEGLAETRFPPGVLFLDSQRPMQWPLPFSWAPWSVRLENLAAGAYEFRVRAVDKNNFAQPEPRPNGQSGIADIQCQTLVVM